VSSGAWGPEVAKSPGFLRKARNKDSYEKCPDFFSVGKKFRLKSKQHNTV
jgi:hypothetical protein